MRRIGITGIKGFIGWHLRCRCSIHDDIAIVPADRETFAVPSMLDSFVAQCDVIVHLAGMNRGNESEIEKTNLKLAKLLVDSMERMNVQPHVLFSSSIHIDFDTSYGRSKRAVTAVFDEWSNRTGALFTNFVFPHIFGENGRPLYNSVVSTFCYQLANGTLPSIEKDSLLELLHVQDVAQIIIDTIQRRITDEIRTTGQSMSVRELLQRLRGMAELYKQGTIPNLDDSLNIKLFNTYRSYLYPKQYPVMLKLNADHRGSLFEAVKTEHGGQAFLSSTHPGITRGDHFHFNKVERFLVIEGQAIIRLRRLFDDRIVEFIVDGREPAFVDIPTLSTHNITNIGDGELLTFFWSHEIFDPVNPDTYREPVALASPKAA